MLPHFEHLFTSTWGTNHADKCRLTPDECIAHVIDGHMKARRKSCNNRFARLVDRGDLGIAAFPCPHSPLLGSMYCNECRGACARGGPQAMIGHGGTLQQLVPEGSEAEADVAAKALQAAAADAAEAEAKRLAERDRQLESKEKDVWPIEALLEKKAATWTTAGHIVMCSLGQQHKSCITRKKAMYLVKWVDYGDEHNSWVCEDDVGADAIADFEAIRQGRRVLKKNKGRTAAEFAGKVSGLYKIDAEDVKGDSEISCETLKEFQYAEKKNTTAGILAFVSCCGLFIKISEIYGSESLTQVLDALYQAYYVDNIPKPRVIVYDDACHLKKFLINRLKRTWFVPWLLTIPPALGGGHVDIVCDKFHFPNHKSLWCKKNVDPKKCKVPGFQQCNTEAAEQAFAWLANSKRTFRHMNEAHFLFFMLRLAHLRNLFLCKNASSTESGSEMEQCHECDGSGEA